MRTTQAPVHKAAALHFALAHGHAHVHAHPHTDAHTYVPIPIAMAMPNTFGPHKRHKRKRTAALLRVVVPILGLNSCRMHKLWQNIACPKSVLLSKTATYTYVELLHDLVAAVKPMQHLPYDFAFENKHESEH